MNDTTISWRNGLYVTAVRKEDHDRAKALADHLGAELNTGEKTDNVLMLRLDENGLTLTDGKLELKGDFTRMLPRLKQNNLLGEHLVKAAKIKDFGELPSAVDATAGLGEDALLLAAVGFSVQLYEYDPVIAALLQDALQRAAKIPELSEIAGRMEFHEGNSITALHKMEKSPDLILLDPMFPGSQQTGLVKKKFQLLRQLEQPCSDEDDLIQAAIAAHPHKIIIKRPVKGPYLGGIRPAYSIFGKGIRFDCLIG